MGVEVIPKHTKFLESFYKKYGDFELHALGKGDKPKWSKWIKYSKAIDKQKREPNLYRTISRPEVVVDIETKDKKVIGRVLAKLDKEKTTYSLWDTGGKGNHIHIIYPELNDVSDDLIDQVKEFIIKKYEGDTTKKSKRNLIGVEWAYHRKTNKQKVLLLDKKEGRNKLGKDVQEFIQNLISEKPEEERKQGATFEELKTFSDEFIKNDSIIHFATRPENKGEIKKLAVNKKLYKFIGILLANSKLSDIEISKVVKKVGENCPQRSPQQLLGWIRKAKKDNMNHNSKEINKWINYFNLPIPYYKDEEPKRETPKNMPEEVREILTDPNILERYNKEFNKRIVKEEESRKVVFIFCNGRLLENQEKTSFNLCVSDESGLGKDYLVTNVLLMFEKGPDKDYIKCEKTTPEVLDGLSKDIDWNYKIFYNEDIRNAVLNSPTFKTFSSGAELFYTYKEGKSVPTEIKGKPVMIITTAQGNSGEELVRRYVNCDLDSSANQTKEIMRRWAKFKKIGIRPDYDYLLKKALTYLRPIRVSIPFAEILPDYFPTEHPIMRTQWTRFLDIIGASTVLHQYQRQTNDGFIEANWQDYDIAVDILKKLFGKNKQVPLSKTDKKIIKGLTLLKGTKKRVRAYDLELKTHITQKTLRERLMQLADYGIVKLDEANEEEKNLWNLKKPTTVYSFVDLEIEAIPKSKEILAKNNNNNNTNFNNFNNNSNNNRNSTDFLDPEEASE